MVAVIPARDEQNLGVSYLVLILLWIRKRKRQAELLT